MVEPIGLAGPAAHTLADNLTVLEYPTWKAIVASPVAVDADVWVVAVRCC